MVISQNFVKIKGFFLGIRRGKCQFGLKVGVGVTSKSFESIEGVNVNVLGVG